MKYIDLQKQQNMQKEKGKTSGIIKIVVTLIVLGIVGGLLFKFKDKIKSSFDPVSIVASVNAAELEETDGRTNLLLLGSDKRVSGSEVGRNSLTDTLLVISIGRVDKDVVLISLPRDLWVKWATTTGNETYSKINAIYDYKTSDGTLLGGIDTLTDVIEEVLGMPVHYHSLVTFEMFEEAIDVLGGIEVTVARTFTDYYYPIEGKENAPINERYETVHFEEGTQVMPGPTALKFVRSRKGDNGEGTDFARSKRQQKVITAIKNKGLSIQTLINPAKLKSLYDIYQEHVDTNIDFATVQSFYLISQQINFDRVVSVVLDDRSTANEGGLLYAPEDTTLYGGQYVLVPQTGDYSQIHAYVQRYLFGNK